MPYSGRRQDHPETAELTIRKLSNMKPTVAILSALFLASPGTDAKPLMGKHFAEANLALLKSRKQP
jgi:hypothetical protein